MLPHEDFTVAIAGRGIIGVLAAIHGLPETGATRAAGADQTLA
jgi:hypothetical protein